MARDRFAFASTLAIYVYDLNSFTLQSVLSHGEANISCIQWEPGEERYLAQASLDNKLVIWDVEAEAIKF